MEVIDLILYILILFMIVLNIVLDRKRERTIRESNYENMKSNYMVVKKINELLNK